MNWPVWPTGKWLQKGIVTSACSTRGSLVGSNKVTPRKVGEPGTPVRGVGMKTILTRYLRDNLERTRARPPHGSALAQYAPQSPV